MGTLAHLLQNNRAWSEALLTAREKDIVERVAIRNSSPDCMWGQDYGT